MTLSIYDLVTRAGFLLGIEEPIQSFNDDTRESIVFGNLWEHVLQNLLTGGDWAFATKTAELSRLSDEPADPNWQYQFQLPHDYLAARSAMDEGGSRIVYTIEGDRVLADSSRAFLKYIFQPEVTVLPAYFVTLYVAALAYAAAEPLVGVGTVSERMKRDLDMAMREARIRDGKNEPSRSVITPSRFLKARWTEGSAHARR
ncbi:hypothetical protein [Pacificispira sp.]|uniref:hypothetical protein n=1 Tax=Pacificispira sp. TaxID=2888761 RepID=UPI003BAA7069